VRKLAEAGNRDAHRVAEKMERKYGKEQRHHTAAGRGLIIYRAERMDFGWSCRSCGLELQTWHGSCGV